MKDEHKFWWQMGDLDERGTRIIGEVNALRELQSTRFQEYRLFSYMYEGPECVRSLHGHGSDLESVRYATSTWNIIRSTVDTSFSIIGKNIVKPTIQTNGGTRSEQRLAQSIDDVIYGDWQQASVFEKQQEMLFLGFLYGDGFIQVRCDEDEKTPVAECVPPWEILINEAEKQPRTLFRRRRVDRRVLAAAFSEDRLAARAIEDAPPIGADSEFFDPFSTPEHQYDDQLVLVEAWHLPSGHKSKDGAYSVAVEGYSLLNEEYYWNHFPFVHYRYSKKPGRFFSDGIGKINAPIQLEINDTLAFIHKAQRMLRNPKMIVPASSRIKPDLFADNTEIEVVTVDIKTEGAPFLLSHPQIVTPEVYSHLEANWARGYENIGLSSSQAQGSATLRRLSSGAAVREASSLQDGRHSAPSRAFEKTFLDLGRIWIRSYRKLYKGRSVNKDSDYKPDHIAWKDFDPDSRRHTITLGASSVFAMTPGARKDEVLELMQLGFMNPEEGKSMLQHPDLKNYEGLRSAHYKFFESQIELILSGEMPHAPDSVMLLPLGLDMFTRAYLNLLQSAPPDDEDTEVTKQVLHDWITQAQDIISQQEEAQMQQEAQLAQQAQPPVQPENLPVQV